MGVSIGAGAHHMREQINREICGRDRLHEFQGW
jgi:hypothetical protein